MNIETLRDVNMEQAGLKMNVFGEYVDPAAVGYQPPPVRTYVITDEMRRQDAQERQQREAAGRSAWRIRSELSVENLQMTRHKPEPGRQARVQVVIDRAPERVREARPVAPVKPQRLCRTCPKVLDARAEFDQCHSCRRIDAAAAKIVRKCDSCLNPLSRNAVGPRCRLCLKGINFKRVSLLPPAVPMTEMEILGPEDATLTAPLQEIAAGPETNVEVSGTIPTVDEKPEQTAADTGAEPLRCLAGCGRHVRWHNPTGTCAPCTRRLMAEQRKVEQATCVNPDCGRRLRMGSNQRPDRRCGRCGAGADQKTRSKKGNHAIFLKRHGVRCGQCPQIIKPGTKTGLCTGCAGAARRRVIVLRSITPEEHEVNLVWAGLCFADRQAVLEACVRGR